MREISILKQRILQYIEYKSITKYEFYKICGLANGILSQSSGLSEDNLLRILNYCRDLNPSWLVTGIGKMIIEDEAIIVSEPQAEYIPKRSNSREKDLEYIIEVQKDLIKELKKQIGDQDAQDARVADAG